MNVLTDTPERLLLGKSGLIPGLICLAMAPLVGFLGVMIYREDSVPFGMGMMILAGLMVGIAILAALTKTRVVFDAEQNLVRFSIVKPWARSHREMVLSDVDAVDVREITAQEGGYVSVYLTPKAEAPQGDMKLGDFFTRTKADDFAEPIRRWINRTR